MREVIITYILQGFDQKNNFFEGWSWLKINNLGLALGADTLDLTFYTSVAKWVKTKSQEALGTNSYVCRS